MSEKLPDNSEQDALPGNDLDELSEDDLTDIELDQVSGGKRRPAPTFIQMPPLFLERIKPQWIQQL